MELSFRFASNNLLRFDMSIEYEANDLQFSSRIHDTPDNLAHILQRYANIDRINKVSLLGLSVLKFRYVDVWKNILLNQPLLVSPWTPPRWPGEKSIEFKLDAVMYFYESATNVCWQPDRELPYWFSQILQVHYAAIKPVLIGTVEHYLPELKAQAKAAIKANAIRRAKIMIGNGEAVLQFLGEVV